MKDKSFILRRGMVTRMEDSCFSLDRLKVGECGRVKKLESCGNDRRRMLDLGLIQGTRVEALQKSPSGDPVAYYIRGAVIALRTEDAEKIIIQCNA